MTHERLLTCDDFTDRLADFLEHDLPGEDRAAMEKHAVLCPDCGPLLADLRRLRIDAANLETLTPSRDLWQEIADRIEAPVVSIGSHAHAAPAERRPSLLARKAWLGVAAAGIMGVTATVAYQVGRQAVNSATSAVSAAVEPWVRATLPAIAAPPASGPTPVGALAANRPSPEATYLQEIADLHSAVAARRGELDSTTVAVLEKNLRIIDEAIAQCRQALAADPSSAYLNETLTETLDNKVRLLRTVATMPTKL